MQRRLLKLSLIKILFLGMKISSKRSSVDTSDFLASDSDIELKHSKKEKKKLKDLIKSPVKNDLTKKDSPKKKSEIKIKKKDPVSGSKTEVFSGPDCCKCGLVCKDLSHLKNHILSHFYQNFYAVLPSNKPYECPVCSKLNRDRITLTRHYAFTHNKLFELTDLTPEMLGSGAGVKRNLTPKKPKLTTSSKSSANKVVKTIHRDKLKSKEIVDSDDSDDDDIKRLLERAASKISGISSLTKPAEKSEKIHISSSEKKMKKNKERDKDRERSRDLEKKDHKDRKVKEKIK